MSTERYSPAPARGRYLAPDVEHAVRASVTIPGSKSLTNRELVIAAIADGLALPSRVEARLAMLRGTGGHPRAADGAAAMPTGEVERSDRNDGAGDAG